MTPEDIDWDVAAMSFEIDYLSEPEQTLENFQLMLEDENLIKARGHFLKRADTVSQKIGLEPTEKHDFTVEIDLICHIGLMELHKAGKLTPGLVRRLDLLSRDPVALRLAHEKIMGKTK